MRLAIDDLAATFPDSYDAATHRRTLELFTQERKALLELLDEDQEPDVAKIEKRLSDVRTALLANPLLDLDRLLVVRRRIKGGKARQASGRTMGWVPNNYLSHSDLPGTGYDNEIALMSGLRDSTLRCKRSIVQSAIP